MNSNSRRRLDSTTDSGGSIRSTIGVDWRRSPAGPFHSISNATWILDAPPVSQRTRESVKSSPMLRAIRDRKSVVYGKSVSVRVDLGGGRTMNKKNKSECHWNEHKGTIRRDELQEILIAK